MTRELEREVEHLRSHDTTRAEIARAAIRSFLRGGFESTTVDDIAAAAGISRRTYFRYFGSKDESLLSGMQELGIAVAEAFRRQPPESPPLHAMRDAYLEVEATMSPYPERQRALGKMLRDNPRVYGALLVVQREWVDDLTAVLIGRRPGGQEQPTDRLLANMSMDAWNIAADRWLEDDQSSLHDEAVRAFDELLSLIPDGGASTLPRSEGAPQR